MTPVQKHFGRYGNDLFQKAFCYAYAKDNGIDHYYQDPRFFEGYEDEIRAMFKEPSEALDMVAIHVRRGDYVNNPFYVDLTKTNYYEDAMLEFPDADFLIFSDDIEWCKNYPSFAGCEFSEGRTEVEDMNLMASCKGIIMANSSFAWWGAFLSDAKVIAPKAWYSDGIERTKLLPEWKRI